MVTFLTETPCLVPSKSNLYPLTWWLVCSYLGLLLLFWTLRYKNVVLERKLELLTQEFNTKQSQLGSANVYYKTNLPLNKHFRHQKCLFRGRFVLLYRATQIRPNLGFKIPGIKAFPRGLARLKKYVLQIAN